jgi:hypothetical protein
MSRKNLKLDVPDESDVRIVQPLKLKKKEVKKLDQRSKLAKSLVDIPESNKSSTVNIRKN